MKVEKEGPGFAFWRAKNHGWDVWAYGFFSVTVEDWWHWAIGLRVLDFNMAKGGHFDRYDTVKLRLGPFDISALYIEDRRN